MSSKTWVTIGAAALTMCAMMISRPVNAGDPIVGKQVAGNQVLASEAQAVKQALIAFHLAAEHADGDAYFAALASDVILLGTDETERNDLASMRAYLQPFFDKGLGSKSVPRDQKITLLSDEYAWFDHMLDKDSFGALRGTGLARKTSDGWKIVQYHWAIPVRNEVCRDLGAKISAWRKANDERIAAPDPRSLDSESAAARAVRETIHAYHTAAHSADLTGYIGRLADDAVILGTDPSERWTRDSLRDLVAPYFSRGQGSLSKVADLNVFVSEDESLAWFDERIERPDFDAMRATGVLRKEADGWKIVRSAVSFLVPNDLAREAVALNRSLAR